MEEIYTQISSVCYPYIDDFSGQQFRTQGCCLTILTIISYNLEYLLYYASISIQCHKWKVVCLILYIKQRTPERNNNNSIGKKKSKEQKTGTEEAELNYLF